MEQQKKKPVYISSSGEVKKEKSFGDYFSVASIHNFFVQLFNILMMLYK